MDTIFALATVPGKSGVAIVRVSGPDAFTSCEFFGFSPFAPRTAGLRRLNHNEHGFIDEALVLLFEEGMSFTGERVVEFHVHGSIAIVQVVLDALRAIPKFRDANAGEFTRRALDNGRLDLTQVEALSDLIEAETEMQRKQALSGFSGSIKEKAELWRRDLISAMSLLEATIDFADEEVPVDVSDDVTALLDGVKKQLDSEISGFAAAERIRSGYEVAIIGPPNIGKSTLLNAMAGRDAAITSEVAGTTRDVIEVRMDLDGLPVTFLDTAGLRDTDDLVESIGIERAKARATEADLRVFLVDGVSSLSGLVVEGDVVLYGKADQRDDGDGVSGKTGQGVSDLIGNVRTLLLERSTQAGLVSHDRQKQCLLDGARFLESSRKFVSRGHDFYELASEDLRAGVFALEKLVGRVDVEDVLDQVFANFCIGK